MIPLFKVFMSPEAVAEACATLQSGMIGQDKVVELFESALGDFFNQNYLATTNSATSAEHLAFYILKKFYGLQDGDEILSTSLTCTATIFPATLNGLKVKWVDIDPKTLNLDYDDLERKLSPKTKVIQLVHWGGYPNDLSRVEEIRKIAHDLYGFYPTIIEDCAHAFGSKYKGRLIGTGGNIYTFSFQAIKHLTSVDGGLLICPEDHFHQQAKLLRWYGISREEKRTDARCELPIENYGFKFHMNDVNASVGLGNLPYIMDLVKKQQENSAYYDKELKDIGGIRLLERDSDYESACWIYSLLVDGREDFRRAMKDRGIHTSQVHERVDKHPCMEEFKTSLPSLNKTIDKLTHIPVGWWVSPEEREHIVESIKKGW